MINEKIRIRWGYNISKANFLKKQHFSSSLILT
jgi:hypothetical protein